MLRLFIIVFFLLTNVSLFAQRSYISLQMGTSTFLKGTEKYKGYANISAYRLSYRLEKNNVNQGFGIATEFKLLGANVLFGTYKKHRLSYVGIVPYYFIKKNRFKIDLGIYFSALLNNRIETNFTGTYIIYKKTDIGLEMTPGYRLLAINGRNLYINVIIDYSLFPIYTEGKGYYIATDKNTKNFSFLFGVSIQLSGQ